MRPIEELKESENFAANTTDISNSTASTEAVDGQSRRFKINDPVLGLQTNKGYPSFYGSLSG